jgi:aminoglycoside phosphotransferase (APT) family kinase protein
LLRCSDQEFVLRRPPFGPVPPKAHDMAREYRILESRVTWLARIATALAEKA